MALEEGFFYDNDSCFHGNPFRQTPEYEAYEQFSLVIGLLTLGRSPSLIHIMYQGWHVCAKTDNTFFKEVKGWGAAARRQDVWRTKAMLRVQRSYQNGEVLLASE